MFKRGALLTVFVFLLALLGTAQAARKPTRREAHAFYRLTLAAYPHQGWTITGELVSTVESRWATETVHLREEETRDAGTIAVLFHERRGRWEEAVSEEEPSDSLGCPPGKWPSSKTRKDLHLGACSTYAESPREDRYEREAREWERELIAWRQSCIARGGILEGEGHEICREQDGSYEAEPQ
jgi:hypothetical protein